MPGDPDSRSYGATFDTVADEYERSRPTYPDELVEHAFESGGLMAGDRVLEIGCGTGQLTRSLVARGLDVIAVEPGPNLIELARRSVSGPGEIEFVHARFEDASPGGGFAATFSASAFHWIDPDVSWTKVARSLAPGGLLALLQHCALRDERIATDDDAFMSVLADAAPEIAARWPPARDLETIMRGFEDRRENVSDVWAWVGDPAVARPHAAALFDEVEIVVAPTLIENTAAELNALMRTLSPYHRMSPAQRDALERGNVQLEERLGRPLRSTSIAVLVTARRASRLDTP
jgi:SAM-dependent methyltransferase